MPHGSAFQCLVCFDDAVEASEVVEIGCPSGHRFCRACLLQHANARRFPRCPGESCPHELSEAELESIGGLDSEIVERHRQDLLHRALDGLGGIVRCPNPACTSVVTIEPGAGRQRWQCECGWPPFCTVCRQPYHYHVECGEVQPLRQRWLQWVASDRAAYNRDRKQHDVCLGQLRALEEAVGRHADLQSDEEWKVANCRECPNCARVVQKLEGCNFMVCGVDAHGGNRQNGCGHRFRWTQARAYQSVPEARPLPRLDVEQVRLKGAHLQHPFSRCTRCAGEIVGPRLRCMHCPSFDLCATCDADAGTSKHPSDHVFEIIFEREYDLRAGCLPVGTPVTLADHSPQHGFEAVILEEVCEDVFRVKLTVDQSLRELHRSGLEIKIKGPADAERHIAAQFTEAERRARDRLLEKRRAIQEARAEPCVLQ